MKLSWLLITIVLIHSFFTCASAAGHVEDPNHQSVDIVFDTNHDKEHSPSESDAEHEHPFHAHISCITGYGYNIANSPVILASQPTQIIFGQSLTHQPPVPPPNA